MIVKTAELTGAALDWAVAKADGCVLYKDITLNGAWRVWGKNPHPDSALLFEEWSPSTNWAQCGPIIDREGVELENHWDVRVAFVRLDNRSVCAFGPTSPIASMRAYVVAKLGDDIEVPDELLS